jgi:serine/threonine protein kinase
MDSDDTIASDTPISQNAAAEQGQAAPASDVPAELMSNQQFKILRELGRGGMGVVFLAHNKLLDRLEVLKVISNALTARPDAKERFMREIQMAARLEHENVVRAYGAMQIGELLVLVMEHVEGQDLAQVVQTQGPLAIPQACHYVRQAALGLQHAHERGMVHRDIKPGNLILVRSTPAHTVKILDFGLAKATSEKRQEVDLTGSGKMLGTPDYMAPEQMRDAAKADIRADIYSLGCTLYFLLTGAPPLKLDSFFAMLRAYQSAQIKPLNVVRPDVPVALAEVVAKMTAKDPSNRYQTPVEAAKALVPFTQAGTKTITNSSTFVDAGTVISTAQATKKASQHWLWVAAGLGAVLMAFAVLWATRGPHNPTSFVAGSPGVMAESPDLAIGAATKSNTVDLLQFIDLQKQPVKDVWKMVKDTLVTPNDSRIVLPINYPPPEDYDVELVLEPLAKIKHFAVHLAVGKAKAVVAVGVSGNTEGGLSLINGKNFQKNETHYKAAILQYGQANTLFVAVRKDAILAKCNGEHLFNWTGSPKSLSVSRTTFDWIDEPLLQLGSVSSYRITKMSLTPVVREGQAGKATSGK